MLKKKKKRAGWGVSNMPLGSFLVQDTAGNKEDMDRLLSRDLKPGLSVPQYPWFPRILSKSLDVR